MGLLIINADDVGLDRRATDGAISAFLEGAVTCGTLMVHMADSARAAARANAAGLPLGLHLNFDTPFAPGAPREAVKRQGRLLRYFRRTVASRWVPNVALVADMRAAIAEQRAAFVDLVGCEPTHFDSHHHLHTSPTCLISGGLPGGSKVRKTFTRGEGAALSKGLLRVVANTYLARAHVTTDEFFRLPRSGWDGGDSLGLAAACAVEVMVHPALETEAPLLATGAWKAAITGYNLGSYRDL